ncbi:MAG: exosortase/archaeosortase family protein [Nitrospirae bacterium]|nr:exosortase/archaeosortase family protein [Nitrospirota bacterium]
MFNNRTARIKFGIIAVLLGAVYYPELYSMVMVWAGKKEYSHGFLIPLISSYIIWTKREEFRNTIVTPEGKGFAVLMAGVFLYVIGNAAFEYFIRQVSFIITIIGLIYFLLGKEMLKRLIFPVSYLFFMIPVPYIVMNNIAISLRLVDATVTFKVLHFFGMPIFQSGATLELPNMTLIVADLCTGILSIVAIISLSVFYAYITQRTIISRLALILLSIPIAVISNMFRLIITVTMAYFIGERALSSAIHEFHGTANFLLTVALLVLAGKLIKKYEMKFWNRAQE